MISYEELLHGIEEVSKGFRGQIDDLSQAVGLMVLGRLFGWRVMRLVSSRRCWSVTTKLFGDPKDLLPERGRYAHKSLGLMISDRLGAYWDFIRGSRDAIPLRDRKEIT